MTRFILTAAAAMAVWSSCALVPANAQATFVSGGPNQHDGLCQVSTDGLGMYGYTTPCPHPAVTVRHAKKTKS